MDITANAKPVRPEKPKWQLAKLFSGENRRATQQYNEDYAMYEWEMQNWYNTPAAQMQRFKDAGLNTNLMYGQGTPGNAEKLTNQPYQNMPSVDAILSPLDKLSRFADVSMKLQNVKNMKLDNSRKGIENMLLNNELTAKDLTTASGIGSMGIGVDVESMTVRQRTEWEKMSQEISKTTNIKKQNELIEKQINWYVAQQIAGMLGSGIGAVANTLKVIPRFR